MAIKGAKQFSSKLRGATDAFSGLDEELKGFSFDPREPESVKAAIEHMQGKIDARMRKHSGNAIVKMTGSALKEQYEKMIEETVRVATET